MSYPMFPDLPGALAEIQSLRDRDSLPNPVPGRELHLSMLELRTLTRQMTEDFIQTHPADFDFVAELGMRGRDKEARLNLLLHCRPMLYSREADVTACAKIVTRVVNTLPPQDVPAAAEYLLSGSFAKTLAYFDSQTYADFFLGVVGRMNDRDSSAFARVVPLQGHQGLHTVLPSPAFNLPPMVLVQNDTGLKISAVTPELGESLGESVKTTLRSHFEREAEAAASRRQFGTSSHLQSAVLSLG